MAEMVRMMARGKLVPWLAAVIKGRGTSCDVLGNGETTKNGFAFNDDMKIIRITKNLGKTVI